MTFVYYLFYFLLLCRALYAVLSIAATGFLRRARVSAAMSSLFFRPCRRTGRHSCIFFFPSLRPLKARSYRNRPFRATTLAVWFIALYNCVLSSSPSYLSWPPPEFAARFRSRVRELFFFFFPLNKAQRLQIVLTVVLQLANKQLNRYKNKYQVDFRIASKKNTLSTQKIIRSIDPRYFVSLIRRSKEDTWNVDNSYTYAQRTSTVYLKVDEVFWNECVAGGL